MMCFHPALVQNHNAQTNNNGFLIIFNLVISHQICCSRKKHLRNVMLTKQIKYVLCCYQFCKWFPRNCLVNIRSSPFIGRLIQLFGTSGNVCLGFQSWENILFDYFIVYLKYFKFHHRLHFKKVSEKLCTIDRK